MESDRRTYLVQLVSLACASPLSGCSVLDFEIQRDIAEQRIEGNVVSSLLDGVFANPITFDVDIEAETEAQDTGPAQRVTMRSLRLSITKTALGEGDEDTFDFLDSLSLFIEGAAENTQLERKKIGELTEVPRGAESISIPTEKDVDLLPYANEGAIITSEASGSAPPDDVTFDGQFTLLIEVV